VDTVLVASAFVFPCLCVLACILIGHRYVAACRGYERKAAELADEVYLRLAELRQQQGADDPQTEVIPRVDEVDQPLVHTLGQAERARGKHRLDEE
jgi:hypothetical protein